MDESDTYYAALILDPSLKGYLLERELEDKEAAGVIMSTIRASLHERYSRSQVAQCGPSEPATSSTYENPLSRLRQCLEPIVPTNGSDIDLYFDSPRVRTAGMDERDWLFD